jgi:uncharacterized protein involved in cysteine biosynthesis
MNSWWLEFIVIWLSVDIVIIATGWFTVSTIKTFFPNWWERVVASEVDTDLEFETDEIEISGYMADPKAVK